MFCIYCGRVCDFDESHVCQWCKIKIAKNNDKVKIFSLLAEAYPYVTDIKLRERIEAVIFKPDLASRTKV